MIHGPKQIAERPVPVGWEQLPVTEGYAGIKSSTGRITPPSVYTGVAVSELVELVGGIDETMGIN
ncbi:MAG: hypothetical protein HGA55_02175, partial [Methanoregulaceae archaeon]|nr:hypothetical protein [Methanoregulaceae archaeon]